MQSIFRHNYPKNIAIILCTHFKQEDNPALFSHSHHKNVSLFSTRKMYNFCNCKWYLILLFCRSIHVLNKQNFVFISFYPCLKYKTFITFYKRKSIVNSGHAIIIMYNNLIEKIINNIQGDIYKWPLSADYNVVISIIATFLLWNNFSTRRLISNDQTVNECWNLQGMLTVQIFI